MAVLVQEPSAVRREARIEVARDDGLVDGPALKDEHLGLGVSGLEHRLFLGVDDEPGVLARGLVADSQRRASEEVRDAHRLVARRARE